MGSNVDAVWPPLDVALVTTALRGHRPGPVRTHWVELGGARWPPEQVVALATGLDPGRFDSHSALTALGRLGLPTGEVGLTGSLGQPPDVSGLLGSDAAVTPADFLAAGRAAAKDPGLYSWWADAAGAADLTAGLGHRLAAGLVYPGRAGGVRPSGVRSTNTL